VRTKEKLRKSAERKAKMNIMNTGFNPAAKMGFKMATFINYDPKDESQKTIVDNIEAEAKKDPQITTSRTTLPSGRGLGEALMVFDGADALIDKALPKNKKFGMTYNPDKVVDLREKESGQRRELVLSGELTGRI
jgi:hypothetical protein